MAYISQLHPLKTYYGQNGQSHQQGKNIERKDSDDNLIDGFISLVSWISYSLIMVPSSKKFVFSL